MPTMIKRQLKQVVRRASALFQTAKESYRSHDAQYRSSGKLEAERAVIREYLRTDMINGPQFRLGALLGTHPSVRSLAVDIGAGTGWVSGVLAKQFARVVAIEPSAAALEIAKKLYPSPEYENISWVQGFAEEQLEKLDIISPTLFITGVVLSHMRDQEVESICHMLSRKSPQGSLLVCNEAWGSESHRLRWHVRTEAWWQERLPGWQLNFHAPMVEGKEYALGFHGVKTSTLS